MKAKLIIISFLFLFSGINAEAQFLKKLKKKVEQAAERALIKKTEEKIEKTTEVILDSIFSAPSSKKDKQNLPDIQDKKIVINETTSSTQTQGGETDLGLEKSVDKPIVDIGETVTFKIKVRNYGPSNATGLKVKDKLPDGYTFINANVNTGNYNSNSGIWNIGDLPRGKLAILTIKAMVQGGDDEDLMNLAEIISCDQSDPDSVVNNGVDTDGDQEVIDDEDDEDDGDGQDVKIKNSTVSTIGSTTVLGIKMVLTDHKRRSQTYYFDTETIAMRVELGEKKKKKQAPMYFDNDGYVYVGEKSNYMKVPFDKVKKSGKMIPYFSLGTIPEPEFPDGTITYYGMDVSPHRFPILEWAWVYKIENFEGQPELDKDILNCRGNANCTKFIVKEGNDAGSYVLFDDKGRLAEIFTPTTGNVVYTYVPVTVNLPNAQEMPFMTDFIRD